MINPFDRQKKHNEVPYSVFPASKLTRTSLPIGRAVPFYCIEMIQGNTWKASINQLTRFMTMEKPVMNDFEVNIGAFFVPYVALDEMTLAKRLLKSDNASQYYGVALKAREFFNPVTPDADRIHPISVKLSTLNGIRGSLVGSLADHLGYAMFDDVNADYWSNYRHFYDVGDETEISLATEPIGGITDLALSCLSTNEEGTLPMECPEFVAMTKEGIELFNIMKFDLWLTLQKEYTNCESMWTAWGEALGINPKSITQISGAMKNYSYDSDYPYLETLFDNSSVSATNFINRVSQIDRALNGDTALWTKLFGTVTIPDMVKRYYNWSHDIVIFANTNNFTANVIRWLAYMRIYGDYFLNPQFTERKEFDSYIAEIYATKAINGNMSLPSIVNSITQYYPTMPFFADYIANCECMPVLWEKDYFTSLLISEQMGSAVAIASGDTIPELFMKRLLQKFKNLIMRMGTDYRDNTAAMYGSAINDSTLLRSQAIGFRELNVTINAIANQTPSNSESNLGDFGGYAYSNGSTGGFEWKAEENGVIMCLCWIRPKYTAISTCVDRDIIKTSYNDYLNPTFGGVGYQDVPLKLLRPSTNSNHKLGIQEIYFEYMMRNNESSGLFRNAARQYCVDRVVHDYVTLSANNPKFLYITEDDDVQRIFNDTESDPILASIYVDGTVTRQLPAVIRTDF